LVAIDPSADRPSGEARGEKSDDGLLLVEVVMLMPLVMGCCLNDEVGEEDPVGEKKAL
jgi:hypothetical protein